MGFPANQKGHLMQPTLPHPKSPAWLIQALRENDWKSQWTVIRWWLNLWRDAAWSGAVTKVSQRRMLTGWHVIWLLMCGPPWREKLAMTRAGMFAWLVKTALKGPSYTARHF